MRAPPILLLIALAAVLARAQESPLILAPPGSDAFATLDFVGGTTARTLTLPVGGGTQGGVFFTLRSACWFQASVTAGAAVAQGAEVEPCTDNSRAGGDTRSVLYYIPPAQTRVTVSVVSGFPVSVAYRAQRGLCSEPRSSAPWALTNPSSETPLPPASPAPQFVAAAARTRAEGAAACAATSASYRLLDVVANNNPYAGRLALACLAAQGSTDNQALVGSWNGDEYGGATLALYLRPLITVALADGTAHNVLCQPGGAPPTTTTTHTTTTTTTPTPTPSNPTGLRLTAPVLASAIATACGPAQQPAVLSLIRPGEYVLAGSLVFNSQGPLGRAWIGGWEAPTAVTPPSGSPLNRLVFTAAAVAPVLGVTPSELAGTVNPVVPGNIEGPGAVVLPVLCQNRGVA